MANTIDISIRAQGKDYVAITSDGEFLGASPDEALGYCIREHWLAGDLNGPVTITIDSHTGCALTSPVGLEQ